MAAGQRWHAGGARREREQPQPQKLFLDHKAEEEYRGKKGVKQGSPTWGVWRSRPHVCSEIAQIEAKNGKKPKRHTRAERFRLCACVKSLDAEEEEVTSVDPTLSFHQPSFLSLMAPTTAKWRGAIVNTRSFPHQAWHRFQSFLAFLSEQIFFFLINCLNCFAFKKKKNHKCLENKMIENIYIFLYTWSHFGKLLW